MIARTCISRISGYVIARRSPRWPSIGLASCSCCTRFFTCSQRQAEALGQLGLVLLVVRQELVQRRVEQADRDRQALHRLEDADEVFALVRQQLGERLLARLRRRVARIISRMSWMRSGSKNMCSVRRQADAFGAEVRGRLPRRAACRRSCGP